MIPVGLTLVEVRRLVQDEREPFRYTDAAIRMAARSAFDTLRMIRPDLVVGSIVQDVPVFPDEFPVHSIAASAFNMLAAANIMLQNEEYANDGTAANMTAMALAILRGASR